MAGAHDLRGKRKTHINEFTAQSVQCATLYIKCVLLCDQCRCVVSSRMPVFELCMFMHKFERFERSERPHICMWSIEKNCGARNLFFTFNVNTRMQYGVDVGIVYSE